jgi:hypothetical protein
LQGRESSVIAIHREALEKPFLITITCYFMGLVVYGYFTATVFDEFWPEKVKRQDR